MMENSSKILLLSTWDFSGAGIGAQLMLDDLNKSGYDATLLVQAKKSQRDDILSFYNVHGKLAYFIYRICLRVKKYFDLRMYIGFVNRGYVYSVDNTLPIANRILKKYAQKPDIIVVCWVKDFINTEIVRELSDITLAKIVYNMIDNSSITGGCHYPFKCNEYWNDCNCCPAIQNRNFSASQLSKRRNNLLSLDLCLIGTSSDCLRAKKSSLFRNANIIPYVQINDIKINCTQLEARLQWKIDNDDFVIFFGAQDLADERKGFGLLLDSLKKISESICLINRRITLLVAGACNSGLFDKMNGFNIVYIGTVPLNDLFVAFMAANVFVCPSVEDSGPMMINYSVILKIPVVAFKMGVALDLIEHGKNGYLADLYNTDQICDGLREIYSLNDKDYSQMQLNCSAVIEQIKQEKSLEVVMKQILGK